MAVRGSASTTECDVAKGIRVFTQQLIQPPKPPAETLGTACPHRTAQSFAVALQLARHLWAVPEGDKVE